jgi:formylglycine-generating enzyme required for sulfatase activity
MLWKLAEKRKEKLEGRIKPIRLAKVVTIQSIYPELYEQIKGTPRYLRELEVYYRSDSEFSTLAQSEDLQDRDNDNEIEYVQLSEDESRKLRRGRPEPPPALASFVSRAPIRRIITLHPPEFPDANFGDLTIDELSLYFTLTRRAETPQVSTNETPLQVFEPQMVHIPPGKFLMGSTREQLIHAANSKDKDWTDSEKPQREEILQDFWIGKYPVTNLEYQAFIRSTSHKPPRGWEGNQYPPEKGDHPVLNVSWNDATAYCEWLILETGKNYHLPTEAEWEKAARGTDGRIWSWGSEFDSNKANTKEANIGTTTPVGQFSPQGDSIYGCADMIGNVWEWCNDKFEFDSSNKISNYPDLSQQENNYIVRGGSFYRSSWDARCATRRANRSSLVGEAKGFRVALSSNIVFDA